MVGDKINCFLFSCFVLVLTACNNPVNVHDGFESPQLSSIWSTDRMVKGALKMQSQVVRNGQQAAMITLKSGDVFEAGLGKSKDTERDELLEAERLFSAENKLYEYRFSLFLPEDFPIVPIRLVIAQWKQEYGGIPECSDDSPVLAIRYISRELPATLQKKDTRTKAIFILKPACTET